MPLSSAEARIAVAELTSPQLHRIRRRLSCLDEQGWWTVIDVGSRHRVLPLMHSRIGQVDSTPLASVSCPGEVSVLPMDVAVRLRAEMLESTQLVLLALAAARHVHEVLAEAGVPTLFLKGVHLAAGVYPQPGLRPMRDIDVLVPGPCTMQALAALERAGARREAGKYGDLDTWRAHMHHLPALVMPGQGIRVELHTSLSPRDLAACGGVSAVPEWNDLWARSASIDCVGRTVRVLSPEDLLVHLVVHAVYQHRLSNGPLALADVGFLLARHGIDWASVWRAAEQQGVVRGCVLLLTLLEREWGSQPIDWMERGAGVDGGVLESASMLLLQESSRPGNLVVDRAMRENAGSPARNSVTWVVHRLCGAARFALWRMFIPRKDLALMYPVKADSLAAFAWYPRHWWRLVSKRLPEYLRYRRRPGVELDLRSLATVERWLAGPDAQSCRT